MVDFSWIRENVGALDVIQLLNLQMTQESKQDPDTGMYYHVWRGVCPACKTSKRALVVTSAAARFTCFYQKISTNPDRWLTGDLIAFYAHVRRVGTHEAAEAISASFAF